MRRQKKMAASALVVAYLMMAGTAGVAGGQPLNGSDRRGQPGNEAPEPGSNGGPKPTGRDAAESADIALLAEATGWTKAQAAQHRRTAEVFGALQRQVAEQRPGLYAGGRLSPEPDGAPVLYIKGAADDFVRTAVKGSGIDVQLAEGRAFSWSELESRSGKLHGELGRRGFRNIATSFDETTATVEATVTRMPGLPDTAQALRASLPVDLQTGTDLRLQDSPVGEDFHAYGGMSLRDDGDFECTSGWAVSDGSTTGVTTAGHCDGINEIVEPDVGVHTLTHQAEHRGSYGDVEWKTSTHIEPAEFYADAANLRQVNAVESRASITVGEYVCVYGRSSNDRYCGSTVWRTSVSCTVNNVSNSRLVAMNNKSTTIGGDSGGGWSFGTTAYGSHKGYCTFDDAARNLWSVADLYDEALGVSVIVQ